jgi:hypothetical protein
MNVHLPLGDGVIGRAVFLCLAVESKSVQVDFCREHLFGGMQCNPCPAYSYARTSLMVRRAALRAGIRLANADRKITTASQSRMPSGV